MPDPPDNGEFERGGLLPPARRTAIGQQLRAAGPAPACAQRSSRFAVLSASKTLPVYVELDGCQRVLIRQAEGNAPVDVELVQAMTFASLARLY